MVAQIKAVVSCQDNCQATRRQIQQGFVNMLANIQTSLVQVGGVLTSLGGKLNQASSQMMNGFAGFDQAMSNTISIANGTVDQFEQLRQKAQQLSTEMPVSAESIADGYYQLASAGYDAGQMLEYTEPIMKLATATASDFGTTAKIVTASIDVFASSGMTANQSTEILMNTVKGFKTTLPELADSMKYSMAVAQQLGISMELLATATGYVRQAGLDSSQAGAGMRMMLQQLVAPSTEAQELMAKYGITLIQTADGSLDLVATLQNINTALANTDPVEKASVLSEVFGARASAVADALLRNADALEQRAIASTKAGSVDSALERQLAGLQNQMTISTNKIEESQMALAEKMIPAQIKANEVVAGFYDRISKLPPPLLEFGGALAVIGGKLMSAVGQTMQVISSLTMLITIRKLSAVATAEETASQTANTVAKGGGIIASMGMAMAITGQNVATKIATALQWLWNASLYACPLFALIGVVVAFTYAVSKLAVYLGNNTEAMKSLNTEIDALNGKIETQKGVIEELSGVLADQQLEYDLLQAEIDDYTLLNMKAEQEIKALSDAMSVETELMQTLKGEISTINTGISELETSNRLARISIDENAIAIAEQERQILDATLGLQGYKDEIDGISASLGILSDAQRENNQAMMGNNIEIQKINMELEPYLERQQELQDKQKTGATLTLAEQNELDGLASTIKDLQAEIEVYNDLNDELRLQQMENSLAISEAKEEMATKEEEYASRVAEATAGNIAEIERLQEANQTAQDTITANSLEIAKSKEDIRVKEQELADETATHQKDQQDAIDDLRDSIDLNNDAIDDAKIKQMEWKALIDDTNESIETQQTYLTNLETREADLTGFKEFKEARAKETALKGAVSFGVWGLYDYFQAKKDIEGYWDTENVPEAQTGIDLIKKARLVKVDPGETILNRQNAEQWRAGVRGGGGQGQVIVEMHNNINISHPEGSYIVSELERKMQRVIRDVIQNERVRMGAY